MYLRKSTVLVLIASWLAMSLCLWAQGPNATVTGIVKDPSRAVIPGAHIVITNVGTNLSRDTVSNGSGEYTVPLLPPGQYQMKVDAPSFQGIVQNGITLQVAQTARLDFTMTAGTVSQTIEVTGQAPLAQTENAAIGAVIENRQVQELPLNGRQYYSLAYLTPGTYQPAQNSTLGFRGGFNVAGSSEVSNNYTLNGFDNNDPGINAPTYLPSVDQIQEFKLLTGVYSAEYGTNSGGQLLVTTKSGTNKIHGTAFDYIRNQVFDARNYFNQTGQQPTFQRNQFGGTVGGPIIKDKTFAFLSYEGIRLKQDISALATVPTQAMLNGDFSSLLTLATPIQLVNPLTRQPYVGNIIDPATFNSIGRALASYYPTPTSASSGLPANNYSFNGNRIENMNEMSVRIDHTFNGSNSVYGTYNFYNDPSYEPSNSLCSSRVLPGFGCDVGLRTQLAGISYTHIFGPTLVNEVRANWNKLAQPRTQQDVNINFIKDNGIQGSFLGGDLPNNTGVPATTVTGFSTVGGATNLPQVRADNVYMFNEGITWTKGSHTIHAGVDFRRFLESLYYVANGRGSFSFTASQSAPTTGYALADLLLGYPSATSRNPYAPNNYTRSNLYDGYVQDDWKVTQHLTVNLGLRYEYHAPYVEKYDHYSSFNPATASIFVPGNGNSSTLYDAQKTNFAPRVGFAWQPFGNDKTVVRAGSGVFYNSQAMGNGLLSLLFNAPFRGPQTFNSSSATPITLADPFPTQNLSGAASAPYGVTRDFKTAVVDQWSLGVQRSLTTDMLLDVSYFGSKGTHLPLNYNINEPLPAPGTNAQVQARRPFPTFGNITYIDTLGDSSYNSLQAKLEKRFSHGLLFITSYTYGHSIDNGAGISTGSSSSSSIAQNTYDLRAERGSSDFDVRHRFTFSPVYELPFGRGRTYLQNGWASKLAGGWQVTGVVTLQSGNPYTPSLSGNNSNTLNGYDRPNVVGDANAGPHGYQASCGCVVWVNKSNFAVPAAATFGNARRNSIQGPGYKDVDFAIARNFGIIPERLKMEFRAEMFNMFNHPNFMLPVADYNSGAFGRITAANDPREIEFALRFVF